MNIIKKGHVLFFLLVASDVICHQAAAEELAKDVEVAYPEGEFVVVSLRRASDVSAPATPTLPGSKDDIVGKLVRLDGSKFSMGMTPDKCEVEMVPDPVVNLRDPMLSDLGIGPAEVEHSAGDKRIGKSFRYHMHGETIALVYQLDKRVIVFPWKNSAYYAIAEIPLTERQTKALKKALKDMKFFHGEVDGKWSPGLDKSIGEWAHYRQGNKEAYRFARSPLSENLLDTLKVLE